MRKAAKTIEADLFALIKESDLAKAVNGNVYRKGQRPEGSTKEDIVVKFLTGREGQIQQGVLILNVFVPDKIFGNAMIEDTLRIEELQKLIIEFVENCKDNEYDYQLDTTPDSDEVEGIQQHYISARISYKRIIY